MAVVILTFIVAVNFSNQKYLRCLENQSVEWTHREKRALAEQPSERKPKAVALAAFSVTRGFYLIG